MNAPLPVSHATNAYDLLDDIADIVTEEPLRMSMDIVVDRTRRARRRGRPVCGAVGCVAGWALIAKGKTAEGELIGCGTAEAQMLLGLSSRQATELFFPDLVDEAQEWAGTPEHAAKVVAHIRAFQQKYAAQLKATKV